MEKRYLYLLWRWLWLFVLVTALAGLTTYWASSKQPTIYQATARLIVGPGIDSPNPDLNALRAGGQLMQTYSELPKTGPFLQRIIDELNLNMPPIELAAMVQTRSNRETQILSIDVQSRVPEQAATIANAVATALVDVSPSNADKPEARLKDQMLSQAEKIEQNIATMEINIQRLEAEFAATTDVIQQHSIMDQISQERSRLIDAHRTLAMLYEAIQQPPTNQVKIIEPASSAVPVASQLPLQVLIGSILGLVFSLILVMGYVYFYDAVEIETAEDLAITTGIPVLGAIARYDQMAGSEQLVIQSQPKSNAAENFRMLGTKLLFSKITGQLHTILLSSVEKNENVSEIAANLGVVLAQTGSQVIIIDANLHKPSLGELFGITNRSSLTDILIGQITSPELTPIEWASGLSVLPAGNITSNAFALLASPHMSDLLDQFKSQVDIVIIAASPLSCADSLFLASHVDGVILAARSGKARRETVKKAVDSLRSVNAQILGTVYYR